MSKQLPITEFESKPQQRPTIFAGFEHPTANFLYCPNQFFDVCLPNYSRGTVRLVAYLLRRTLGWLDQNGEPIEQEISVSYSELVTKARISRGAVRIALDEATNAGFITRTRKGSAKSLGDCGQSAEYSLQFDDGPDYIKAPEDFRGFFASEGNRTPIPNAFFDRVVLEEPLAVVKVVGTVLRHTVGYQNQFGGRRTHAPLSYSYLQAFSKIIGRSALSKAISHAIDNGYITCVEEGVFDFRRQCRRPASYAVRWLSSTDIPLIGSKSEPVDQANKWTRNSPKNRPVDRFKKGTKEKTQKYTSKQQQVHLLAAAVSLNQDDAYQSLRAAGFDDAMARRLVKGATQDEIVQQIKWLPQRNPKQNQLGLLRRAIEEKWSKPTARTQAGALREFQSHNNKQVTVYADLDHEHTEKEQLRAARLMAWAELSANQRSAYFQQAITLSHSDFTRSRLRRHRDLENPPTEVLALMPRSRGVIARARASQIH